MTTPAKRIKLGVIYILGGMSRPGRHKLWLIVGVNVMTALTTDTVYTIVRYIQGSKGGKRYKPTKYKEYEYGIKRIETF